MPAGSVVLQLRRDERRSFRPMDILLVTGTSETQNHELQLAEVAKLQ